MPTRCAASHAQLTSLIRMQLAISIETLAEQIESKLAEDGALEAEIQTLSMNNSKFYDQAAKHSEIVQTWNSLREKLNVHNSAAERLRQGITELRSSGALALYVNPLVRT